ncbi:hypothetical protein K458DRAFT_422730 [Lentithecium fluviatile CBS 122367]|uniref:ML-like domain-containing protein n=1 Tax=Lentithecium fluviatile CBS 122367 TaxID=1168545 RepID=A0A6G1IKS2_9PLEO|nr:hypothetical protein K458DRAFT_422730 [Lentithecium fluviatile CBS 122367]
MTVTCVAPTGADIRLDSRQRELPSLQPTPPPPRPRRKRRIGSLSYAFSTLVLFLAIASLPLANAVFINFENCLARNYRNANDPVRLQWTPMHVWASFDTHNPRHHLNVTVYGNVSGQAENGVYPPRNSEDWQDPNKTLGKFLDVSQSNNKYSTLFADFTALTYSSWSSGATRFCNATINATCPIGPAWPKNETDADGPKVNASDPYTLPAFSIGRDFYSTYSFATWEGTMRIVTGDATNITLGCISTTITPDLGSTLADALAYFPAAILALVAIATVFAATCSPWGSANIFRWTSNYGRDEDLIRLVTPGFGDCLQYIQFIVLAGSLSLNYPGYFQPVISQASWSVLMFNQSLVTHGNGSQSLVDGIYFANGTYGLSRLGQYVGMTDDQDVWAGMAVWLLVLVGIVTVLVQLGFLADWTYRVMAKTPNTDLRGKNWPFSAGNIVRIMFNYFLLPIITLSFFQMVVAPGSPASVVATAVVLLIGIAVFAIWIFWFIFTTRPRAHLFDDLPTVLTYGPLYNTYSDDAAPFAFIPVLLNVIRGIAIGAIQPSGIAQIIILAICEVILILTLHAFRPFQSNTSMNAYHTFFSSVRLISTLLMVAFVPSLGVSEASKGWIGYVILLLHAFVLVFGFFLNSLQTIIEVAARLTGAGVDQRGGLTKVFGKRQLAKRNHRHQRSSLNSDAAMLGHEGDKVSGTRTRSLSGSSAILLNGPYGSHRGSVGFDGFSQGGEHSLGNTSPGTPATHASPFNFLGGSSHSSRRPTMGTTMEASDPYYRPPRPRKQTMESIAPVVSAKGTGSADHTNAPYADNPDQAESGDAGEGPSSWSPNRSITPAFLRMHKDESDTNIEGGNNTDYSVRESDFYYGLRGPALSAQPTRKLKTGPADPMGPVSSATGWFKSLGVFGGKKKEKGKGFEVVRSTRMPPQMMIAEEEEESPPILQEPYRDSPGTPPGGKRSLQRDSPDAGIAAGTPPVSTASVRRPIESDSEESSDDGYDTSSYRIPKVSDTAPTLGPIDAGGGIELPSRIGSRASHVSRSHPSGRAPKIPRKSSRRTPSTDKAVLDSSSRLSTVMDSAPGTARNTMRPQSGHGPHLQPNPGGLPIRLPFGSTEPSPSPEGHSAASSLYPTDNNSDFNALDMGDQLMPPPNVQTGERPLSTGYVHQHHLARDNYQNPGYDAGNHLEASAEIVDRTRTMSTQRSGNSYRSR